MSRVFFAWTKGVFRNARIRRSSSILFLFLLLWDGGWCFFGVRCFSYWRWGRDQLRIGPPLRHGVCISCCFRMLTAVTRVASCWRIICAPADLVCG